MNYAQRRTNFSELLQEKNTDNFLVTNLDNIFYLTGFNGTNALLWHKSEGDYLFITDPRYEGQAKSLKASDLDVFIYQPSDPETLTDQFPLTITIEDSLTLKSLESWKEKVPKTKFKVESDLVETLRIEKDKDEVSLIRKAQHHVDHLLITVFPKLVRIGVSEKALAFKLEQALMEGGKYGLSFASIVGFSENSAMAHHQNGDRRLKPGDNILVDCGVTFEGYCSDITRNFSMGAPSLEYQNKYELLLNAQEGVLKQIKSGKAITDLDRSCRQDLGEEARYFTHSLGHGVGVEIHESPRISGKSEDTLKENMIITVEPGIYYEGQFGIRIEDLVWVQKDGCEILSQCPKELIIL